MTKQIFRRISHIRGMPFVAVALTILRCKNTQRAFAKAIADQKAGGTPPRTPSFFFIISQCLVQSQTFSVCCSCRFLKKTGGLIHDFRRLILQFFNTSTPQKTYFKLQCQYTIKRGKSKFEKIINLNAVKIILFVRCLF